MEAHPGPAVDSLPGELLPVGAVSAHPHDQVRDAAVDGDDCRLPDRLLPDGAGPELRHCPHGEPVWDGQRAGDRAGPHHPGSGAGPL